MLESASELQALTDRRRSRSRRRRRDTPSARWIGSITRSPPPLTDLPARVACPRPTTHSANLRSEYPPEEWLGSNYLGSNIQTTPPSALAIQDTPPGDLRPCSTPDQQPPTNISHHYATPLPPTTSPPPPPPDNTHTTPPFTFPPPPPVPRVIEPMLSPFRPTNGGIAGFLQRASHANIPPPSSLTPTSST